MNADGSIFLLSVVVFILYFISAAATELFTRWPEKVRADEDEP